MAKDSLRIDTLMQWRDQQGIKVKEPVRTDEKQDKVERLKYELNILTERRKNPYRKQWHKQQQRRK